MRKALLIVLGLVAVLLIAGMVVFANYRHNLRSAEPIYSGTQRLSGLRDSVNVRYDRYAVPHIRAKSEQDLYFAAGYVAASERMWQMEFNRLVVQGRLAEFLGAEALEYDKFIRTIGINELAVDLKDYISENALAVVEAYVGGINAFLDTHRENLPAEYRLLDIEPEPWKVEHSLGLIRLMAWELNAAWYLDIVLDEIYQRVGEQKGGYIFPEYPADKPVVIPERDSRLTEALFQFLHTDKDFRQFRGIPGRHIGSNSWVVSGEHSRSGFPILANDPHLGFSQPPRWYEMHLQAPDMDVAGVTIPGMPLVVIGHNDSIAWGLTNAMIDDADFFEEEVDPDNPYLYMHEGQWTGMQRRKEIFRIKNQPSDSIIVRITKHGPIISDIHPLGRQLDRIISMRWVGHEMSDEVTAIYQLNKAANWREFNQAVNQFHVPGQNIVYADIEGNIGLRVAAKIPIRGRGVGDVVQPGTVDDYEWTRFLTPQAIPSLYNPSQGYIATANNKIIDEQEFEPHISNLYEPPSRIERILELLESKPQHSVQDFQQYQMDCLSPHAREVTPYFIQAFRDTEIQDEYVRAALTWLNKWDSRMDVESIPATIFNVAFVNLVRNTYRDEMGDLLFTHYLDLPNASIRNLSWLLDRPVNPWWDDVTTNGYENRDIILRRSLLDAIDWLAEQYGRSMINWQWGRLHTVTFPHPLGANMGWMDNLYGFNLGPFEKSGSGTTLNNGEYYFNEPYKNVLGPSMRQITDLADPDNALSVLYSGQSGHPLNPHYRDQVNLWLQGKYHSIPLSEHAVGEVTVDTLLLTP